MIVFDHVHKTYVSGCTALNDVTLTLGRGEMAFLTGHSGAGKSTLLKMIMLIERPNRGQVFVDGKNITRASGFYVPTLRRKMGVVYQNPNLLNERNVYENVALPLVIEGYRPQEIRRRVRAALDKVGLLSKEKSTPMQLSSGEQQRVGIARAVVSKPKILIADEPTGNLDPDLSREIMRLFEAFNGVGASVLIATHDLTLVAQMHHRVIALNKGYLVKGGGV